MEPKKRKSYKNIEHVGLIRKVYAYLDSVRSSLKKDKYNVSNMNLLEELELTSVSKKVSELCDIPVSSVYKIINSEDKENDHAIKKPRKPYPEKIICDPFCISMIRRVTQSFYDKHEYPTVTMLWKKCREDENFPPVSRTKFYYWLIKKCKFKYKKIDKKPVFLERTDIVASRENYLRDIKNYRNENYNIFYSDETWASPDQACNNCWQMFLSNEEAREMKTVASNSQLLRNMNGFAGGFLLKSAAGRVIINHIGNEQGFLKGAEDIFVCKKDKKNYHDSMDHVRYIAWFKKVLEVIPDKSVIVVDLAPYHRKKVEGTSMPNMSWRKDKMLEWFATNKIHIPPVPPKSRQLTRPQLVALSKQTPVKPKFIIEKLAEESGKNVKVLWLPPAHCEFNAIELIWANVKQYIGNKNTGKNIQGIKDLAIEAVARVSSETWRKCVEHVKVYENIMWDRDNLIDSVGDASNVNSFIIAIGESDSSDSESDESDNENLEND